ncbi:hypothetical protein JI766_003826, partial [Acinetobacter baumannii]
MFGLDWLSLTISLKSLDDFVVFDLVDNVSNIIDQLLVMRYEDNSSCIGTVAKLAMRQPFV